MDPSCAPQPLPLKDPTRDASRNHYWSYHALEELLACKQPLTESQDEDLFIAVHQICELAFHQMILDLERVLEALALALNNPGDDIIGDTQETRYFLTRVLRVYEVTLTTLPILTTMRAFAEFRTQIGPTSGFQSFQFRHLEIMSGVARYWQGGTRNAQGELHVAETEFERQYGHQIESWYQCYQDHNLAHYYRLLLQRVETEDLNLAEGYSADRAVRHLLDHPQAGPLLKHLRTYDTLQTRFHQLHLGLAAQQLHLVGADTGTGGTSFRDYLARYEREIAPLFPGLPPTAAAHDPSTKPA